MTELALAPVDRIIRKAGAKRVAQDATEAMADALEEIAVRISERAVKLAKHAGRKTVKKSDIKLAKREVWG